MSAFGGKADITRGAAGGIRYCIGRQEFGGCVMHAIKTYLLPLARLLMSSLFIWDGTLQLRDPGGTAEYFASVHVPVPDFTIWISIVIHLVGGLAILVG